MTQYHLEFILHAQDASAEEIRNSLVEFGKPLEIIDSPQASDTAGREFKIDIDTEDPTLIFDACSQLGRIRSVKVDEI